MTALAGKLPRLHNVTMRVKEWEGDVVFLHEVGKGAADRSYGVQVARLAGCRKPWSGERRKCCTSWRKARFRARPTGWSTTCRCFRWR
ncbi:hypothetical protein AJ88_42055 [Mesorhizobium amorphae CCBAU 01583]|nr:hypothetical protein AJ88_42055 [Mesorhizobium amorphae CCBAU 01583]